MYTRNIAQYASNLLAQYPAIAIVGARQVGKTTLAKQLAPEFGYLDLEKITDYDRISHDPDFFFKQRPSHMIFDEAQVYPELFPTLRGVIDEARQEKGRFILTGSSSPELLENISESLAGRIAIIELGTLKANEIVHRPLSDFYSLFQQPLTKALVSLNREPLTLQQVQRAWFFGGYPEPISQAKQFYPEWMADYETTYVNRDVARLFPKLDKIAYQRFIAMLGGLSSKTINKSDLARSINVSEPTINRYLEIADGTFIWRKLPSFENNVTKSLIKMPRGHIRDSGLLHHLLRINDLQQLQQHIIAGFSFEAFIIEEILKGIQDAGVRNVAAYYYRTRSGAEIDLILKGNFGVLPIEIKYGSNVNRRQLVSLSRFIETHSLPFGLVINQAEEVIWLTENILQVPAGFL